MINKKGFEFSFGWLFAIIVGAVIIFLAIYATTNLIKTEREIQDTELGKQLGIILNPIETALETGKASKISFPLETRLYNDCSLQGTFGSQKISTATKSGIGEKWLAPGEASTFRNKYLFSDKIVEDKNYIVFSKPLEIPFKIANLIYIWPETEEFCFVAPPREIEEELTNLKLKSINFTSLVSDCSKNSKKVCFTSSGCDIDVSFEGKSLKKKYLPRVFFETSSLLYGAIFTNPEIYECQIKRLMKRASELSWLYYSKSIFLTPKGCSSNLESYLASYANQTFSLNSSLELSQVSFNSEIIRRKNNELSCKLF